MRKWAIWYDPWLDAYYVILKVRKEKLTLQWLSSNNLCEAYKSQCSEDIFIKIMTPLEKELL